MYAIVDIETTGGYAAQNCITEIAIILHNGTEIEGNYQTLINPERPIQKYVQGMTGITDAMVAVAPKFEEVAANIYNLLTDRIFVAHNVNFDYSFVKQHLKTAGYDIDLPKICTIKMARKFFPGLPKYGLASLCHHFNIANNARHRAYGDAKATTELLMLLLAKDKSGEMAKLGKKRKQSQYLPPNLTTDIIEKMPSLPGVYYFHNNKGKVVYVGKAINLKKRVSSHFSNNKPTKQKQDFLRDVYNISWTDCSSNLTACILESIEIKRLWPIYNKSQKHYERQYGIFMFEDSKGYNRLAIDNKKKILQPLAIFQLLVEARQVLFTFCKEHNIEPYMFFLSKEMPKELPELAAHNSNVETIVNTLNDAKKTYLLHDGAKHYVLVEKGIFYGMGKIEILAKKPKLEKLKTQLTPYPNNTAIQSYIHSHIINNPDMLIVL
ncbi:MAG: exonuclease domain-containing protein [Chitinophagaceae bacterium]